VKVAVLADTHIRRGGRRRLPDAVYAVLDTADAILHAGDLLVAEVLDELSGFAPVHAVLGNNDHELFGVLPATCVVDLAGVEVAMVHDTGPAKGRERRVRTRFPAAQLVVYGHSHIPADVIGLEGQRLFNPGSSTERRMQPAHTMGVLDLDDGHIVDHRILVLD
jgi:putative phosphoesterase